MQQTQMLYAALGNGLMTTILNGTIIAIAFWSFIDHLTIVLWYSSLLIVNLARTALLFKFKAATLTKQNAQSWLDKFAIGCILSGLVWGMCTVFLFPSNNLPLQMLMALLIAGMASGAITSLSYVLFVFQSHLALSVLPLSARFLYSDGKLSMLIGGLLMFYVVMLMISSKRSYFYTLQNIRLRRDYIKQKEVLTQSEKTYQSLFELSDDANLIVDNGKLISCNQSALTMFGYTDKASFLGEQACTLSPLLQFGGSGSQQTIESKIAAAESNQKQLFEWQYMRQNGQCFPVEVLLSPIKFNGKQMLQMILRDITYRKTTEQHLVEAKKEAEQAYKVKSEFLSQMSHELRTPLNAVLGFGQLLQLNASNLTPIQQTNVREILSAGNHLLLLVNDVLDLTQIENGKMIVSSQTVSLDKLLKECIPLIKNQCGKRHIQLVDNISNNRVSVQADFIRLKQVMLNLLSNAVKYNCENGSIIVDAQTSNNKMVKISVVDTGKGLTDEEMTKLFVPFERLGVSNNIEGNGIGLSICKQLVELMGGRIEVASHQSGGCVFTVELKQAGI